MIFITLIGIQFVSNLRYGFCVVSTCRHVERPQSGPVGSVSDRLGAGGLVAPRADSLSLWVSPVSIGRQGSYGYTPLHEACYLGHEEADCALSWERSVSTATYLGEKGLSWETSFVYIHSDSFVDSFLLT